MKRVLTTSALFLTVGLTLAACGGSSDEQTSAGSGAEGQQAGQPQTGQGQMRLPGGSGKVTDVSGSTAQVQGQDSQVAVSWSGDTKFTQQVAGKTSDVVVGSCVMVTSADTSSTDTTKVAAATVRITEAVDGSCSAMGGGGAPGGGQPPSDGEAPSGERPTDMPTDMPTDGPGGEGGPGGGQRGGFAVGEVTAVSGSGFTVSSQRPGSGGDAATSVTVTTSADTTYTTTESASASDVKVGVCVTSRGKADDTGAIAATTIAVSVAVDGECSTGFGGGRPGVSS